MQSLNIPSNPEDAYLLAKLDGQILAEQNSHQELTAASLVKTFYALDIFKKIEDGSLEDRLIDITQEMVSNYGTNVLGDLATGENIIKLNISTLVGLMIKYSCNSSTSILKDHISPSIISETTSLEKLLNLFQKIFGDNPVLEKYNEILQYNLKTSRNIFYMFDQLEVKVLGSKSGTLQQDGYYYIGDSGVIEINGERYFLAAIVKRERISDAVIQIRQIGKQMAEAIKAL